MLVTIIIDKNEATTLLQPQISTDSPLEAAKQIIALFSNGYTDEESGEVYYLEDILNGYYAIDPKPVWDDFRKLLNLNRNNGGT